MSSMFEVHKLNVAYGDSHVIHDVSFSVQPGSAVAIVGRNGIGKLIPLKSLIGMVPARKGTISLEGKQLMGTESHQRVPALPIF